jgi:hypothetical protein
MSLARALLDNIYELKINTMTYNYFTTQIYNNKTDNKLQQIRIYNHINLDSDHEDFYTEFDNKLLQPLLKENNLKRKEIYFSIL